MEKDAQEPQKPEEKTTVTIPFAGEVTVPTAIVIPLVPIWKAIQKGAFALDGLARRIIAGIKGEK